jgi:hypothetical protein
MGVIRGVIFRRKKDSRNRHQNTDKQTCTPPLHLDRF